MSNNENSNKQIKNYKPVIVLGLVLLIILSFFIFKNIDAILLKIGIYDQKITILNTADVHGHIVFDDSVGGYYSIDDVSIIMGLPLVKYLKDEIKKKENDVLFFDCGDLFHGTNEANIEKGKGVVEIANLMGYDAMEPGNHDFNFGIDRLMEIKSELKYPMICSNMYRSGKLAFEEYKIYTVKGIKVAVFGLETPGAYLFSNTRDFKGITINDPVETAQKLVPQLRKQADVVVLLSHLGDVVDWDLAKKVNGIDLILSAHLHALYKTPKIVNNTYIVEPGGWTTHLGVSELYFKNKKLQKMKWDIKTSRDKSKADPELAKIGNKYYTIAYESQKEIIGKAEVKLIGIRSLVRSSETNLADLLCDAMRITGKADIALMNGGGIRQSIPAGNITIYQVGSVLPFVNKLVTLELKGDVIYKVIETGLNVYPAADYGGGFLQVSGIKYTFDASKPAGKRLVSITKDGKPLDRNSYYKVATNDYLYNGGDWMSELENQKLIYSGDLLKNILVDYIKEKKLINPQLEGRITSLNERYK